MNQSTLYKFLNNKTTTTNQDIIDLTTATTIIPNDDNTKTLSLPFKIDSVYSKEFNCFTELTTTTNDGNDNDKKKYPGITTALKKIFYNHYNGGNSDDISKNNIDMNNNIKRHTNSNKKKGTMIHRHIYHLIHCVKKTNNTILKQETNDNNNKKKKPKKIKPSKMIIHCECNPIKTKKINKSAKQAMQALKDYNIIPIESEVPIISKTIDYGTALDIVGKCKNTGKYVIISIKTGYYNNTVNKSTIENMSQPLQDITNSPYNHHQLQALVERAIVKYDYNTTIADYYILYLDNDVFGNYKMVKMENWCKQDALCLKIFRILKESEIQQ